MNKDKITFKQIAKDYIELVSPALSGSSLANIKYNLENYVMPCFGNLNAKEISKNEILSRMHLMKSSNGDLKESTKRKNFELIKRIIKNGIENGHIEPFLLDFKLDEEKSAIETEENFFSAEEVKKITEAIKRNPINRNVGFLLSLCFGLKIGEICGLKWEDFNFPEKSVHIHRIVQRILVDDDENKSSKIVIAPISGKKLERTIYFSAELDKFINENVEELNGFVTTGSEEPFEPRVYRRMFDTLMDSCELQRRKFKAFKVTYERMKSTMFESTSRLISNEFF